MDSPTNQPVKAAPRQQAGRYAVVALVAVLIGFVPTWIMARGRAVERDAAQQALGLARLENTLGAATIHARRGDYEVARAAASSFYTNLGAELGRPTPPWTATQVGTLQTLLADRDQMITLLARSDPASAERLADAYVGYRAAVGTASGNGTIE